MKDQLITSIGYGLVIALTIIAIGIIIYGIVSVCYYVYNQR